MSSFSHRFRRWRLATTCSWLSSLLCDVLRVLLFRVNSWRNGLLSTSLLGRNLWLLGLGRRLANLIILRSRSHLFILLNNWLILLRHLLVLLSHWFFLLRHWLFLLSHWLFLLRHWLFLLSHWFFLLRHWFFLLRHLFLLLRHLVILLSHLFLLLSHLLILLSHLFMMTRMLFWLALRWLLSHCASSGSRSSSIRKACFAVSLGLSGHSLLVCSGSLKLLSQTAFILSLFRCFQNVSNSFSDISSVRPHLRKHFRVD